MYPAKFTAAQVYGMGVSMKWDIARPTPNIPWAIFGGKMISDAHEDPNSGFVLETIFNSLKSVKDARGQTIANAVLATTIRI